MGCSSAQPSCTRNIRWGPPDPLAHVNKKVHRDRVVVGQLSSSHSGACVASDFVAEHSQEQLRATVDYVADPRKTRGTIDDSKNLDAMRNSIQAIEFAPESSEEM